MKVTDLPWRIHTGTEETSEYVWGVYRKIHEWIIRIDISRYSTVLHKMVQGFTTFGLPSPIFCLIIVVTSDTNEDIVVITLEVDRLIEKIQIGRPLTIIEATHIAALPQPLAIFSFVAMLTSNPVKSWCKPTLYIKRSTIVVLPNLGLHYSENDYKNSKIKQTLSSYFCLLDCCTFKLQSSFSFYVSQQLAAKGRGLKASVNGAVINNYWACSGTSSGFSNRKSIDKWCRKWHGCRGWS